MEINSMSVVVGAIDYIEAEKKERQDMCAWEQGCISQGSERDPLKSKDLEEVRQ